MSMPPTSATALSMILRQWAASWMSPGTSTALRPARPGAWPPSRLHVPQDRQSYVGALARIGDRHRAPNAAVSAGDDRLFVFEPARALVGLLAVVGHRLHLGSKAGHR